MKALLFLLLPVIAAAMPDDSIAPAPKTDDPRFMSLHQQHLARTKAGHIGLLFLGDSITEYWSSVPDLWDHYYGRYQPANFGIAGDGSQHVLWRINHGILAGISPRVVVLMIGTNNTGGNSAAQIAATNRRIVATLREKLPNTKILLLGIFPRASRIGAAGIAENWRERMAIINAVNGDMAKLDDGDMIRFLDISDAFRDVLGKIPAALMPDQLHPGRLGYEAWAIAMQPLLTEMMQDTTAN